MLSELIKVTVLFAVIFDPLASLAVFLKASANMDYMERGRLARLAVLVAGTLSFLVLFFGHNLLAVFSTSLDEFRVAGGIVLGILGLKMALGQSLTSTDALKDDSVKAVAAIIGTPLLTGPAAITAIIVTSGDYGKLVTGFGIGIVLFCTALLFTHAERVIRVVGKTAIQIISTLLGLITLAWGVSFVTTGLKALFV